MPDRRIPATLAELAVPISGLTPYGANPRRSNLDVIKESLTLHGQYRPIVVRTKSFEVLAGNHTLAAAQELGWTEIAASFVEVSDDEAARIVLVDNRAADLGDYDNTALLDLLRELELAESSLLGTGYVMDDLDDLAALLSEAEDEAARPPGGTEANAWETTGMKEYAERYEEQGRRLIVLDYDRADYARVTAALDRLRADTDRDSNSSAVAAHLAELYPDVAAEAVAAVAV